MSHWNYRIVTYAEGGLGLHEVFYDDTGTPCGLTERAVGFVGEDADDLRAGMDLAKEAFEKPHLRYEDFPSHPTEHPKDVKP